MIREAKKDDLESLVELYKHLNPEDDYSNLTNTMLFWESILDNPIIKCLVLEEGRKLLATCTLITVPNLTRSNRPYSIVENVVTHPDFRGRGHGRSIMEEAIRISKKSNCYKIMLQSSSKRVSAHKFYRSLGFDSDSKVGFHLKF